MAYGVYKGHLDEAIPVVEAWLKKKKHRAGSMSSLWRTVDFRCKALADSLSVLPHVQWDAPAKLRVALWTPGDAALFVLYRSCSPRDSPSRMKGLEPKVTNAKSCLCRAGPLRIRCPVQ